MLKQQWRIVMKNSDTIEIILQVIHEDNLNFMAPNGSFIYASNLDNSTASTISESSNSGENWQATEREERIKERVNGPRSLMSLLYSTIFFNVSIIMTWAPISMHMGCKS